MNTRFSFMLLLCLAIFSLTVRASDNERSDEPTTMRTSSNDTHLSKVNKTEIYLSAFFSLGGNWDGSGILPAVEMAFEQINTNSDILPDYDLRMVWNDTRCDSGLATRVFFDQLYHSPRKLMVLGPPCSTGAQAVAETATHWHLVTLSYSAASSALSNREQFPLFFRTYLPDAAYNPARIRLMKDFNWNRVATIHENHDLFSLAIDNLLTLMKENNITAIKSESFSETPKNQIENLKKDDAKIIVGNMYEDMARRMFCEAYKQGMTGPDYVWILIGWYGTLWWEVEDPYVDCTIEEMKEAVENSQYISTESLQLSTSSEPTVAGITAAEYDRLLHERLERPENQRYVWNGLAPYGYDAAWTIALMLDKATKVLETKKFADNRMRRLEDFTYDDNEMTQLFFDLLTETDFHGVSGPVSFKNGDRVGVTQIEQLQAGCSPGWEKSGSLCYNFHQQAMTWDNARTWCKDAYAQLVTIVSRNELNYLLEKIAADENIDKEWFIGLTYGDSDFEWLDGESLNTTFGDNSLPRPIDSNQTCVIIAHNGEWRNADCLERKSFICQTKQEFTEQRIALYTEKGDILEYTSNFQWKGGKVPLDHTPRIVITIIEKYIGIIPEIYFSLITLASLGIFMACFFLGFNIKYRHQRYVKMSSPNLNNIIILGCILVYSAVFLFGLDNSLVGPAVFEIICQMRAWVISIGFVIAYGAMFSKTWRVHRVATLKTPKRRIVTDRQLYVMVLVLVLIDVAILTVWQILNPFERRTELLVPQDDPEVANQKIQPILEYCYCDNVIYWLGALYGYKGLMLIFGTFLAWETRKVSIPALNDSKYIGMSVYNVIILCVIGVSVNHVISHNVNASFAFLSSIDIFCTSITLLLVFIPKIVSVSNNPEGKPVSTIRTRDHQSNISQTDCSKTLDDNSTLKERVTELEEELKHARSKSRDEGGMNVDVGPASRGCGCWCCGLICGCSSPLRSMNNARRNEDIGKHAHVNETVDSGNAESMSEF